VWSCGQRSALSKRRWGSAKQISTDAANTQPGIPLRVVSGKHLLAYLDEYVFCFARLVGWAVRTRPATYRPLSPLPAPFEAHGEAVIRNLLSEVD
jgi:hypothetical protein